MDVRVWAGVCGWGWGWGGWNYLFDMPRLPPPRCLSILSQPVGDPPQLQNEYRICCCIQRETVVAYGKDWGVCVRLV